MQHRFKPEDNVWFSSVEEVVTIQKLTEINGNPAYWTNELSYPVLDCLCEIPATPAIYGA